MVRVSDGIVENIIVTDGELGTPWDIPAGYELKDYQNGHRRDMPYDFSMWPPPLPEPGPTQGLVTLQGGQAVVETNRVSENCIIKPIRQSGDPAAALSVDEKSPGVSFKIISQDQQDGGEVAWEITFLD